LAGFALVIVAVGLLYSGVWQFWPYIKRTSNELERKNSSKAAFVLGASMGLLAILIHSMVDFNMHIPANAITAITLMAMLTAHWRFGTEGYWVNPRKLGKALLAATVLGAAAYLMVAGARAGREFYWLQQVATEKMSWDQEVASLKKAHEIEPCNYLSLYELGEFYRWRAWQGDAGYQTQAREAMKWFEDAMILNPYDPMTVLQYGRCLDWLDRRQEATRYFLRANELLPYNSTVYLYFGQHCMELGNYAFAAHWFEYSAVFAHGGDGAAYYKIARERMDEAAKGIRMP
jgi:tetratricopeptide (TPR) repeat protein